MSADRVVAALAELQELRGSRAVAYVVERFETPDVYLLYDCLRAMGKVETLDVVVRTGGGEVDLARRLALLLHEHCERLRILVPDHALSSGTLLCLAANELTLGPMARLSPIDAHITSAGGPTATTPARISAEDVRAFPDMARAWFGLEDTDRARVFDALSQRLFPTTLSAFYRADRSIRRVGRELFAHQRPDLDGDRRGQIVDHLVEGYDGHSHAITRTDARELGLNVTYPSPREEELMWACARVCRDWHTRPSDDGEPAVGVIASGDGFSARHVVSGAVSGAAVPGSGPPPGARQIPRQYWDVSGPGGEPDRGGA